MGDHLEASGEGARGNSAAGDQVCIDTQRAMHSFGDAFEAAVLHQLLADSSGMVEMQRLFTQVADGAVDQNCR